MITVYLLTIFILLSIAAAKPGEDTDDDTDDDMGNDG